MRRKDVAMPLIFLALLIALPVLDVYATLRFAEALGVPGIALFVPGIVFGVMIMKRESKSLRSRIADGIQSMSLHATVFDSGKRMLAAVLLLMPGFVSDVFALFLLLIPNRTLAMQTPAPSGSANTAGQTPTQRRKDTSVVDGEYRRID
jgi:UPF0716 protein FxsA